MWCVLASKSTYYTDCSERNKQAECGVQVGRDLAFSLRGVFTGLKKTPSEGYLGPCQKPMMKEVFLAEVVNVFQQFTFSQKSTPIAVRHNPKQDIILNRYFSYDFYCSTS